MRKEGPTSWLLDGHTGWRTAVREHVSVGDAGLQLAHNQDGPLHLDGDGLGRLVMPRGMAFDHENILYLLTSNDRIVRFDPVSGGFEPLPTVGGFGSVARRFNSPTNIAINAELLYVTDTGNRRVQVFGLQALTLRHLWTDSDVPTEAAGAAWCPQDVVVHAATTYVLDQEFGRVFKHLPGMDGLRLVISEPEAAKRWSRLALDRNGRFYLLDVTQGRLDVFDGHGRFCGVVDESAAIRERFDVPPILADHRGRFCLPPVLAAACDRSLPALPPDPEDPIARCRGRNGEGVLFDRDGNPAVIDADGEWRPPLYDTVGQWYSQPLNSDLHRCQWHRVELELSPLPEGTTVEICTYADDRSEVVPLPDRWVTAATITGSTRLRSPAPGNDAGRHEFLIQSREGQYLRLLVRLAGDGFASPRITRLRVHYPRQSYLQYLPAVFSEEVESRSFLERILSIFQTTWDDMERRIAESARYFDPAAVPGGAHLDYLASWLALPLEGSWSEEQRRRLLKAAPALTSRRGTLTGLRDYLRVYLENMIDAELGNGASYPAIIEGFRERNHLALGVNPAADLPFGAPLWGLTTVGRFQLGVYARAGEARLVSTGDPERDVFHTYAHRFRVFIPASWAPTAAAERMLRRAIDDQKPAHTKYDLCLVEPRIQVGMQSTDGIDTIIGDYPVVRLACAADPYRPPSRSPRGLLGLDTVLAGADNVEPVITLTPGTRVGVDTAVR